MKQAVMVKTVLTLCVALFVLTSSADTASHLAATSASAPSPPVRGASTVVLANSAPANIDLVVGAGIVQSLPQAPAHFWITPTFYYHQSSIIQFSHGEALTCNGITLPMTSRGAYDREPVPAAGTVMNCRYRSPRGQATFSFPVPARPTLLSPASQATIIRSAHTPLTIGATSRCKAVKIVTGYLNAHGTYQSTDGEQTDSCAAQHSFDSLHLPTGPGLLGTEEFENVDRVAGNAGFHSLTFVITTWLIINVTWR